MCNRSSLLFKMFRFIFYFYLLFFIFFTLILFMNVLFSVVLLKINYLHYLLTMTQTNKILNISVTAVRNLLASIVLPLGENCGVVYDTFRHFIFMACTSACVVVNTAICVNDRPVSCQMPFINRIYMGMDAVIIG